MSEGKEIIFESEAREKLAKGIRQLADAVRATLGPKGRNVGLEKSWGAPIITNDGYSIVNDIVLPDQFENMGVAMAKEVASKLKDKCGDGTTTGTLLLDALVQHGIKGVAAGASPIGLKRGIDKAVDTIVKKLEEMAIDVKTFEDTKNIATVSASGNEEIGSVIAQALDKVGREGVVTIEEAKGTDTTIELVEGMQFDRGYISPYFASDQDKRTTEMESPLILITDKKISSIQELIPILQAVAASGKELLMIVEDLEADVLATLVINKMRGTLKVIAVKAPGFGDRRKAMLEDLAILTGATLISEDVGIALKDATPDLLGSCDRVVVTKETTTLVGGTEHQEAIQARIEQIETEYAKTTSSYDKEKLLERKAKLKGGVAVIRVGAATEPELKQRKQAFEDSLNATKAALEEGIVPGGGMALLRGSMMINKSGLTSDEAHGAEIMMRAAETPARQIIENTGFESSVILAEVKAAQDNMGFNARNEKIEDLWVAGVVDPVKVVKNSLLHAASVAGMVLISEALIGDVEDDKDGDQE